MTVSGDYLFLGLILLALGLTALAVRVSLLLFRLVAGCAWLGLAVFILVSDTTNLSMGDPWTQILGYGLIAMVFAVLSLQFVTEVKRENRSSGVKGSMGTPEETWTTWGPKKKYGVKKVTDAERQLAYRQQVRGAIERGRGHIVPRRGRP